MRLFVIICDYFSDQSHFSDLKCERNATKSRSMTSTIYF